MAIRVIDSLSQRVEENPLPIETPEGTKFGVIMMCHRSWKTLAPEPVKTLLINGKDGLNIIIIKELLLQQLWYQI